MYDELVKRLRCQLYGNCPACVNWYTEEVEPNLWLERCLAIDAADAIDELQKRVPPVPHGRLIDADALMLEIQEYIEEYGWETDEHGWHNEKWCAMKEAAMVIDAAPTILEAEEGET